MVVVRRRVRQDQLGCFSRNFKVFATESRHSPVTPSRTFTHGTPVGVLPAQMLTDTEKETDMLKSLNRRSFTAWCSGTLAALTASRAAAAIETPSATEGPYYPQPAMRFDDVDNDLVKIAGMVEQAGGEIITLSGRALDTKGTPLEGHRIEIWQCDANGKYMHPRDRNTAPQDMAFQGFGHDITAVDGAYSFRTIKPVSYPGRTPHIHVKVFDGSGREVLTSQFYLAGHPLNARDRIFAAMSAQEADSVSMVFDGTATTVDVIV